MPKSRATQQEHVNDAPAQEQGPVNLSGLGQDPQNTLGNAAVASQTGVNGGREDISRYTPEYVEANRDALGIPPGAPIDDFFLEFVAHNLVGEQLSTVQNLTPDDPRYERVMAQRQLLESWGYNPNVSADQEVIDPTTGLYGVRLDPSEAGAAQGKGSIMSFRATEPFTPHETTAQNPWGAINDLITDAGPYIGSRQYDPHADRIREIMAGGQGDMTVAGYSLGGYLAQRAAADNADLINNGEVVTFQSGGLHREHTDQFNQANADGHIDVRHHQTNMDVVHRAGEAPLPGTFFEHTPAGFTEGHTKTLMYDDNDTTTIAEATGGKTTQQYSSDPNGGFQRHLWEGSRNAAGGAVRLGMSPFNAAYQTGLGLGEGIVNAGNGLVQSGQDTWNGLSNGFGTATQGLGQGAGQLANGDVLQGLGTMGGGLIQGTGQALSGVGQGLWGLGETAVGAVADTGSALYNGGASLVNDVATGAYQVGRGAMNLVEGGAEATWEGAKWAGNQAVQGAQWAGNQAVQGAQWAGNKAVEGAQWAGNKAAEVGSAIGSGLQSAWDWATPW